jgi:CRP-like cAMP-binding protein
VNEGEIFGEIGLLQGSAASAFVIANTDGVVL